MTKKQEKVSPEEELRKRLFRCAARLKEIGSSGPSLGRYLDSTRTAVCLLEDILDLTL